MSFTYTTLKAALIDFTADKGTAFAAAIDTVIPLGEQRILRDLDLTIFDEVVAGTLASGTALTAKPTGCLATRDIIYTTALGGRNPLFQRDFSFVRDYWPTETDTTATPKYFAEYSDTHWWIAGTPNAALTYSARIMKLPAGLSGSNANSWLGTNVGDLLFYSVLACATEYLKNDARLATWVQEYTSRVEAAKNEFWMLRRVNYMPMGGIPSNSRRHKCLAPTAVN